MDAEQSHDPHAPEIDYRAERYRRAGATPAQMTALYHEAAAMTGEALDARNAHTDSVSDDDLREQLEQRFGNTMAVAPESVPQMSQEEYEAAQAEASRFDD